MAEADVISLFRESVWTMLQAAAPILIVALVVGLAISFAQALTQIQEMTLTFVPKIVAILATTLICLPFIYHVLADFTTKLFGLIVTGFQ
jgi:flagellar biosynthetic protein FliQ